MHSDGEGTKWLQRDGSCRGDPGYSLVDDWVDPEYRWFNMYRDRCSEYFKSPDDALLERDDEGYIGCYKIDVTTGKFNKEKEER